MVFNNNHLPSFSKFISESILSPSSILKDEIGEDETPVPVSGENKINVDGIDISFTNNVSDIKENIHRYKQEIIRLEKIIEKLVMLERNETPRFAQKIKAILSAINKQGLEYSYEACITAYCEISGLINIKANGTIDSDIGDVINEVFSSNPTLDYYEMPSDNNLIINVKW